MGRNAFPPEVSDQLGWYVRDVVVLDDAEPLGPTARQPIDLSHRDPQPSSTSRRELALSPTCLPGKVVSAKAECGRGDRQRSGKRQPSDSGGKRGRQDPL